MFIGISGNIRTGKTLIATIIAYCLYLQKVPVYSNYHTKFSKLISPLDLINFKIGRGLTVLDEIHTMIDSRLNSQAGRFISYFITQSGKRGIHIMYTTQSFMMVDKRLRRLTHIKIVCFNTKRRFRYRIYKLNQDGETYRYMKSIYLSKAKAKKYYNLYNTEEIVYAPDVSSEATMSYSDLKKKYISAPTKQAFKYSLRSANPYISLDTAGAIYDYLKTETLEGIKEVKNLLRID